MQFLHLYQVRSAKLPTKEIVTVILFLEHHLPEKLTNRGLDGLT